MSLKSISEDLTCVVFSFTDEDNQEGQQGESSSDPMDSLYRDVLSQKRQASPQDSQRETGGAPRLSTHRIASDQLQDSQKDNNQLQDSQKDDSQSKEASDQRSELLGEKSSLSVESESSSEPSEQQLAQDRPGQPPLAAPTRINIRQPIGSLHGAVAARSGGPLTVRGEIETISDEEILKNRESEEGIQSIPRFRNYQPGTPSKVSTAASTKCLLLCKPDDPDGELIRHLGYDANSLQIK